MNIIEFLNKIANLDVEQLKADIVNENSELITNKNRNQLTKGKTSKGENIQPSYRSETYADVKQTINSQPAFGTPDLEATGSFKSKMVTRARGDVYLTTSTDSKSAALREKYVDIFGLNEESLKEIRPVFTKLLFKKVDKILK